MVEQGLRVPGVPSLSLHCEGSWGAGAEGWLSYSGVRWKGKSNQLMISFVSTNVRVTSIKAKALLVHSFIRRV